MARFIRPGASWPRKFAVAARGVGEAVRRERSFAVHLVAAAGVVAVAAVRGAGLVEWSLLVLCIAIVLAAELFNTALEHLARAITPDDHDDIRAALDTASGAVLIAAIGAAVVGVLVLVAPLAG
jgi:diacylglycerol kinase (ATP)